MDEEKISNITNPEEQNVAQFLYMLGFTFKASQSEFFKSQQEKYGEIDLLYSFENYLFVIEVSKKKDLGNKKTQSFFNKWMRKKNLERLREKHNMVQDNVIRMYFDFSKDTPENKSQEILELTEPGEENKVIYRDDFERFLNSSKENNIKARHEFLDFLGIS